MLDFKKLGSLETNFKLEVLSSNKLESSIEIF